MSSKLAYEIQHIARAEEGVEEVGTTNCGERVNEYKAATTLDPEEEWPWCAAFVCWVVREAMRRCNVQETATFKRPLTAAAWAFEKWSLAQDQSTWTKKQPGNDIEPGDLIVFNFSHCGIAMSKPDEFGMLQTIEGNTNGAGSREGGAVLPKLRNVRQVRSRIRFRV